MLRLAGAVAGAVATVIAIDFGWDVYQRAKTKYLDSRMGDKPKELPANTGPTKNSWMRRLRD